VASGGAIPNLEITIGLCQVARNIASLKAMVGTGGLLKSKTGVRPGEKTKTSSTCIISKFPKKGQQRLEPRDVNRKRV